MRSWMGFILILSLSSWSVSSDYSNENIRRNNLRTQLAENLLYTLTGNGQYSIEDFKKRFKTYDVAWEKSEISSIFDMVLRKAIAQNDQPVFQEVTEFSAANGIPLSITKSTFDTIVSRSGGQSLPFEQFEKIVSNMQARGQLDPQMARDILFDKLSQSVEYESENPDQFFNFLSKLNSDQAAKILIDSINPISLDHFPMDLFLGAIQRYHTDLVKQRISVTCELAKSMDHYRQFMESMAFGRIPYSDQGFVAAQVSLRKLVSIESAVSASLGTTNEELNYNCGHLEYQHPEDKNRVLTLSYATKIAKFYIAQTSRNPQLVESAQARQQSETYKTQTVQFPQTEKDWFNEVRRVLLSPSVLQSQTLTVFGGQYKSLTLKTRAWNQGNGSKFGPNNRTLLVEIEVSPNRDSDFHDLSKVSRWVFVERISEIPRMVAKIREVLP